MSSCSAGAAALRRRSRPGVGEGSGRSHSTESAPERTRPTEDGGRLQPLTGEEHRPERCQGSGPKVKAEDRPCGRSKAGHAAWHSSVGTARSCSGVWAGWRAGQEQVPAHRPTAITVPGHCNHTQAPGHTGRARRDRWGGVLSEKAFLGDVLLLRENQREGRHGPGRQELEVHTQLRDSSHAHGSALSPALGLHRKVSMPHSVAAELLSLPVGAKGRGKGYAGPRAAGWSWGSRCACCCTCVCVCNCMCTLAHGCVCLCVTCVSVCISVSGSIWVHACLCVYV